MDTIGPDCVDLIQEYKAQMEKNNYDEQELVYKKQYQYIYVLKITNNECKCEKRNIHIYYNHVIKLYNFINANYKTIGDYSLISIEHDCKLPQQDIYYTYETEDIMGYKSEDKCNGCCWDIWFYIFCCCVCHEKKRLDTKYYDVIVEYKYGRFVRHLMKEKRNININGYNINFLETKDINDYREASFDIYAD